MPSFNSAWGLWHWENAVFKYTSRAAQLGFPTRERQFVAIVSEKGETARLPRLPHEKSAQIVAVKRKKLKFFFSP